MAVFNTSFTGSENPLLESGAFESVSGFGDVKKVSGVAQAALTTTHALARYIGTAFGDNQYSRATNINDSNGGATFIATCTRLKHSDGSGFYLVYKAGAAKVTFFRVDGGTTGFNLVNEWVVTPTANCSIKLVSRGIRHFIYYNDVLQGIIWDDTYHDGAPGIEFYADGAVANSTIGDWEAGDDDLAPYIFTSFSGAENPLTESGGWTPLLNDTVGGGGLEQRWYGGLQKGTSGQPNVAYGVAASGHYGSFRTESFPDDQYAAVTCTSSNWAGVMTRVQANAKECYLAFYLPVPDSNDPVDSTSSNLVRLFRYDRTNVGVEGFFKILARAAPVQTIGSVNLVEMESVGDRHRVYITSVSGQTELGRELVIDYDASGDSRTYHGGAPGCAVLTTNPIYDFWCNVPHHFAYVASGGFTIGGAGITSGPQPPYPTLAINPAWPMSHTITMDTYVADFGDGFEQRMNFNAAYTRSDGEGGQTSYKGRNTFTLRFHTMDFAGDAKTLWAFYKARSGNMDPFYIYNIPDEAATIDETGLATTGRYLVRFQDPNLTREKFTLKLYNAEIRLIEVRR